MFELPTHLEHQSQMEAYMRNQFPFAGVKTTERRQLSHDLVKNSIKTPIVEVFAQVDQLLQRPEREYFYVAIDLLQRNVKRMSLAEVEQIYTYLNRTPWWDSVDALRKVIGTAIKTHPEYRASIQATFVDHTSFWWRRVGITLQLGFKQQTDITYLTQMIEADITTNEFFIQKGIGWALRDYAKTNPAWVKQFVAEHEFSKLAQREALKHLK